MELLKGEQEHWTTMTVVITAYISNLNLEDNNLSQLETGKKG